MIGVDFGASPDQAAIAEMKPADRAYHAIRAAILSGELPGGAHLAENALAELTGTSRTPVREALQRLAAEGLALSEGRSRFVADFSYEEIAVVFELRARIEAYGASLAARCVKPEEVARMADLVARMDEVEPEAPERFLSLNADFHHAVLVATGSRQLRSLTAQALALPLVTIKRFFCEQEIDMARSNAHHRDILEAMRNRDPDWAHAAMLGHVLATKPTRAQGAARPPLRAVEGVQA
ncbi:MAG: DNA-binding GntR family transcriptional regulator [Paracoccaceae bacterium]|jgi:DNA-binding GntR family transcriptional regulator